MIYSLTKCQSSYDSVSYGAMAIKICRGTKYQKVSEQLISQKNVNLIVLKLQVIYSLAKCQSCYDSAMELQLSKFAVIQKHQKVGEQHISEKKMYI